MSLRSEVRLLSALKRGNFGPEKNIMIGGSGVNIKGARRGDGSAGSVGF